MTQAKRGIRILIADDHTIFREGLKTLLSKESDFHVIGECSNGEDVCKLVEKFKPDILLLDLLMPKVDGMQVLRSLAESDSGVKTIVLSGEVDADKVAGIFELGTRGLVMKDSAITMLFKSIHAVMDGQYWMGRQGVANLVETLRLHKKTAKKAPPQNFGLTSREMEVVKAAASGRTNKEIADLYHISEQTVKHHITNIFDKLGVYNRLEMTLFVFHHGLIEQ